MDEHVINPNHYKNSDGTETIDVVQQTLTPEEFKGFLKGNTLKYELRAGKKRHIDTNLAADFLGKLPKGNEAILRDDVVRIFTQWQVDVNSKMHKNDIGKRGWFIDKLCQVYKENWRGIKTNTKGGEPTGE